MDNDKIFEPLKEYESLREKHSENVKNYFQNLVNESQIDVEKNRETIKKINKEKVKLEIAKKDVQKYTGLSVFLIVLISFGVLGIIIGSFAAYRLAKYADSGYEFNNILTCALGFVLGIIFIITFSCVLALVTVPKRNEAVNRKNKQKDVIQELTDEANEQMQPLNSLFVHGIKERLVSSSMPLLQLDRYFENKRIEQLKEQFGFSGKENNESSFLYLLSGEIQGNPFVLAKDLNHKMGTKTYHGTLTIYWTETVKTSNGVSTVSRQQTLSASVNKPCPYYNYDSYMILGSEVEPKLSFEREPHNFHLMTNKEKEKYIKSTTKELKKFAEKEIGKSNFTLLANEDFESVWYAKNRNEEKSYRVLFTPLAQKNLMELLSDNGVGYGDDFTFKKEKKLNLIIPEHLSKFNIDFKDEWVYKSHDFEVISKNFFLYNMSFFKHLFFTFAPIFSIPIYQQTKTHEYIYKDVYNSPRLNRWEYENIVNELPHLFTHSLSKTKNIIKTQFVKKTDKGDLVNINSWGYKTIDRVDYIPVYGGDGSMHNVPVNWVEYIKVEQDSLVEIIPTKHYKIDGKLWDDEFDKIFSSPELKLDLESGKIYDVKSSIVRVITTNDAQN